MLWVYFIIKLNSELYDVPDHNPTKYGCLDTRLGVCDKSRVCETCHQKVIDCAGHFGHIELALPVFHIGYLTNVIEILRCICKKCYRVLLSEPQRTHICNRMLKSDDTLFKKEYRKSIIKECQKVTRCPYCGALNGKVKKIQNITGFRIVHERYTPQKKCDETAPEILEHYNSFKTAISYNDEIEPLLSKSDEIITPLVAYHILSSIQPEDLPIIWMDEDLCAPQNLIFTKFPVPPVCIRPTVASDTGTTEDDLSISLLAIIARNNQLKESMSKGGKIKDFEDQWDSLQSEITKFINGEVPGSSFRDNKPIKGIITRLKGKQGRFRGNLAGKRVEYSGRSVISPDPNLSVEQVGIPVEVAMQLTYPVKVTDFNKKFLQKLIINGPDKYPGANYVKSPGDRYVYLRYIIII